MSWTVIFHDEFEFEFNHFPEKVRKFVLAAASLLASNGPTLGRPYVDTLNGSKHNNLKELRITVPDGEWRVAFAFDPERSAVILVAGNKSGVDQKRFYRNLIRLADMRYTCHLSQLEQKHAEDTR